MSLRSLRSVIVLAAVAGGACKKDGKAPPKAPVVAARTAGAVGSDGVRRIAITADAAGYTPSRILAKPGEKLDLVFTRTIDADCISQLKTPDGKLVALPMNTPVEVPVTVPASGELTFVCGMDMFRGVIVAEP